MDECSSGSGENQRAAIRRKPADRNMPRMNRSFGTCSMSVLFDDKIAAVYDAWAETAQGRRAYELEGELIVRLGRLASGHRILEVGCGTGIHLEMLRRQGPHVLGVDVSPHMLRLAHSRLGKRTQLCLGEAENLPFRDKSFDSVALITTLEFISNPRKAIQEAVRVSRRGVLLGVLNSYSLPGVIRRINGRFRQTIYNRARFYSIWQLKRLIAKVTPEATVDWASVLVLPISWQSHFPKLERWLSFRKNPLGAFLGLAVLITED